MSSLLTILSPYLTGLRLINQSVLSRSFHSKIGYNVLFPNKSYDMTKPVELATPPEVDGKKQFSGYIPIEKLQVTHKTCQKPGGQHVNKTQSGVEIRFHVDTATWIPDWIRENFKTQQLTRINKDGYFIVSSEKTRKAILNQADCLERIRALIRTASKVNVGLSEDDLNKIEINKKIAEGRRLNEKRRRSEIKTYRRQPLFNDASDYMLK